jgi:hypothetical protein
MAQPASRVDYFTRARNAGATGMFIAGIVAIIGALLDWVTITKRPAILPASEVEKAQPFNGIELTGGWIVPDGWWVIGAGVVLVVGAVALVTRQTSGWPWLAFFAAVVIGAIAFADYRGIGEFDSAITRRMDIVGRAEPGLGIKLVAGAAVAGLIAAVAGVASVPKSRPQE